MKRIHVITGATGFIGAAIVGELLRHTDDEIVAIVRPGGESPEERFRAAFAEAGRVYAFEPDLLAAVERCRVVAGDITRDACGVEEQIGGPSVHFWHCAASLRYENRYREEIRAANVGGTRHALALAQRLNADAFHYLSTAYVAGNMSGVLSERLFTDIESNNHYERSKFDAEQLVAAATGFRTSILRPSIVVGHSRTFQATTFAGFYGFVRQLVQFRGMMNRAQHGLLERTPVRMHVNPDAGLNLIPVDAVASQVVRIGLCRDARGVFHITHSSQPSVGLVLASLFRSVGLRDPSFVRTKDELDWIGRKFDERLDFYGSYLKNHKTFERIRSDALLGGEGGNSILFDERTIRAFARFYITRLEEQRAHLPVSR